MHASPSPSPRWPYFLFFAIGLAFCTPYLRPGHALLPVWPERVPPWDATARESTGPANPLMRDALVLTYPARLYNAKSLRAGEIPFWNPPNLLGYPHLAQIQNNALYPLTLPFDLLDPVAGMAWAMALHLGLAGALMFAFLRALGLDWRAALAGGLAFELNGFFLVRLSAPSYVFSGAWLPLMLLGVRRMAQSGRLRKGWSLALATALSVLGGHPQITGLSLVLAVAFLAGQPYLAGHPGALWRLRARALVQFAVLILLGVALAGYQVVPLLELVGESARSAVPLDAYRRAVPPALALVQAALPDVFGHPVTGDAAGREAVGFQRQRRESLHRAPNPVPGRLGPVPRRPPARHRLLRGGRPAQPGRPLGDPGSRPRLPIDPRLRHLPARPGDLRPDGGGVCPGRPRRRRLPRPRRPP